MCPAAVIKELENNEITCNLHVHYMGFYPHAMHHFCERKSGMKQWIFIYCMQGAGWYEFRGHRYEVVKNQFFILPPCEAHKYGADATDPWTICWIHFAGHHAPIFSEGLYVPTTLDNSIAYRLDIFDQIFAALESGFTLPNLIHHSCLLYHFLSSFQFARSCGTVSPVESRSRMLVENIKYLLEENIGSTISVADIAKKVGCSKSHISNIFVRETSTSIITYYNQLKIRKACDMLLLTNLKINQICHRVGIGDCYYFTRLFKQVMGITPTQYRKEQAL